MNPGMLSFPKQNILPIDPQKNYQTVGGSGSATASLTEGTVTNILAFTTPNTPGMIYTCNINASILANDASAAGDGTDYTQIAIPGKPTVKVVKNLSANDGLMIHTVRDNQYLFDIGAVSYFDKENQEHLLYGEPFQVGPNAAVYVLFYINTVSVTFSSISYALVYSYLGVKDLGDKGGRYE